MIRRPSAFALDASLLLTAARARIKDIPVETCRAASEILQAQDQWRPLLSDRHGRASTREAAMEAKAIKILDAHRTMAISTLRPDGWPQTTIVGYANDGLLVYFLISRASQKLANIERDDRISVAIGEEPEDFREAKAVYAGAHASEVTDPEQREHAWRLLMERHPNLRQFELPNRPQAAMMRAPCLFVSILDFSKGLGHSDALTVSGPGLALMQPARDDDWGYLPASVNKENP